MPRKRNNPVLLTAEDRATLEDLIASGHAPARQLTHARILLKADDGADKPAWPDTKIADALEVSRSTVFPCAREVRLGGLGGCSGPSPAEKHQAQEARWRAGGAFDRSGLLGASEGQKALECKALGPAVRKVGVCRGAHLKGACKAHSEKSAIKPWLSGQWSLPPKQNASFVWRMEDVLEV